MTLKIEKEQEPPQVLAQIRYLEQSNNQLENRILELTGEISFLRNELMKYENFRMLKEHYISTIAKKEKQIMQLKEKIESLESWAIENKARIDYFTKLAAKLEEIRSGMSLVYIEREIVFLNPNYYHELESYAAKIDSIEYEQNKKQKEVLYDL